MQKNETWIHKMQSSLAKRQPLGQRPSSTYAFAMISPRVCTGLERLLTTDIQLLAGRKVGLICNASTVNSDLAHAVDLLAANPAVNLIQLFGPEHGLRGDAQDMIAVTDDVAGGMTIDPATGLPIHSLYGADETSLWPPEKLIQELDTVIWDIQDVGARYYTYVYSMAHMMEVAAKVGTEVICLDRPNPIGGLQVEGNIVEDGFRSFVGRFPLPNRHGLTAGELARWFRDEQKIDCELHVVPMHGWNPAMNFGDTGLPWVLPSPNMPTPQTALVYPGMCLFEGTMLSEGRGHTRPFEVVGAPFIDGRSWANRATQRLHAAGYRGFVLRPLTFRPTFHKYAGEACGGVQIHVQEPSRYHSLMVAVALLQAAWERWPDDCRWRTEPYEYVRHPIAIDLLSGDAQLRLEIESNADLQLIAARWDQKRAGFMERIRDYHLYSRPPA